MQVDRASAAQCGMDSGSADVDVLHCVRVCTPNAVRMLNASESCVRCMMWRGLRQCGCRCAALCVCVCTPNAVCVIGCKWIVRPLHDVAWTQAVRM